MTFLKNHGSFGFALLVACSMTYAADEGFDLTGNIQTQATKSLYDNDKENNLDGFWFRANIGGNYKSEDFDAKVTIRMYAPNFNNGSDRYQADTYYGNYKWNDWGLNLKLGHWKTDTENGGNFGAYLDKSISKRGFLSRDYSHDALEVGFKKGISQLNVMLATGDGYFNQGYLRVTEDVKINENLNLGVGYRANVIDPIQYSAIVTHRANLRANVKMAKNLSLYGEAALIITGEDEDVNKESIDAGLAVSPDYAQDTKYFPVYAGIEIPTAGILDKAFVEVEYVNSRDELNADADDWAWAAGIVKKLGSRTKAQVSVYSENELSDVAFSARITTTIK